MNYRIIYCRDGERFVEEVPIKGRRNSQGITITKGTDRGIELMREEGVEVKWTGVVE